jgi:hypothetical protein
MKTACLKQLSKPISNTLIRPWNGLFCTITMVFLFINQSCKKSYPPQPTLPPITQQGYNTFGCMVDDHLWLPNAKCNFFPDRCRAISVIVSPQNNGTRLPVGIRIMAMGISGGESSSFVIQTKNPGNPSPNLIFRPGNIYDSLDIEYQEWPFIYQGFNIRPGTFEITKLDTLKGIISGTFAFTLHANYRDSIVVTDGRFDLQFSVCKCFN